MKDAPFGSARESMGLVYDLAVDLGFKSAHFDVRKANEKVWQFHEKVGAERVGETEDDYLYKIFMPEMLKLRPTLSLVNRDIASERQQIGRGR